MRLITLSQFGEPRNTRELVVRVLADNPCLSFQQVVRAAHRAGFGGSGRAVWKHLQNLLEDQVIERQSWGTYAISPTWIEVMRGFCDIIERGRNAVELVEEVKA